MYGHLEVICGPMFASKTTLLLKRILWYRDGRKSNVLVLKPSFDTRYNETRIVSHDGLSAEAQAVSAWPETDRRPDAVMIDEVQFMAAPRFDGDIVEAIRQALAQGTEVVAAGLDMDWQGRPFETTARLIAMADTVTKVTADCTVCGRAATKSFKRTASGDSVELGAGDLYEARCNVHWGQH